MSLINNWCSVICLNLSDGDGRVVTQNTTSKTFKHMNWLIRKLQDFQFCAKNVPASYKNLLFNEIFLSFENCLKM